MPAKKAKINLIPQEEFAGSSFGRILSWTLSSFRVIVILTEMCVMLAFLSRFWLDARLSDLNDLIKQKQSIISSQAAFEKDFRALQKKLKIFTSLTERNPTLSSLLTSISSYLPQGVILSSFTNSRNVTLVRGKAENERAISQFVVNLEASGIYEDISLLGVDSDTESPNLLIFNLSMGPKQTKGGQ